MAVNRLILSRNARRQLEDHVSPKETKNDREWFQLTLLMGLTGLYDALKDKLVESKKPDHVLRSHIRSINVAIELYDKTKTKKKVWEWTKVRTSQLKVQFRNCLTCGCLVSFAPPLVFPCQKTSLSALYFNNLVFSNVMNKKNKKKSVLEKSSQRVDVVHRAAITETVLLFQWFMICICHKVASEIPHTVRLLGLIAT